MSKLRIRKDMRVFLKQVRKRVCDCEIVWGTKHPKLVIYGPKESRFVTLSFSPSDKRNTANAMRNVIQTAKEVGAIK